jgi:hypothetical protein
VGYYPFGPPVSSSGPVLSPSGDQSGASDAIAINAYGALYSSFTLAPGNWYIKPGMITISSARPVWIFAYGANFYAAGNNAGPLFRIYDSSVISQRGYYGGCFYGGTFYINGTNGSYSIHLGDIFGFGLDVRVISAAGSAAKGIWFDNNYYWTEQLHGRVYTQGCSAVYDNSTGVSLSAAATGSFDRNGITHMINTLGLCDGVVYQGGAICTNPAPGAGVYGNMSTGLASYAALRITGSNAIGYSYLNDGLFPAGVECDDAAHTPPQTIAFGAPGNQFLRNQGTLSFNTSLPFANSNAVSSQYSYYGLVDGDSALSFISNQYPSPLGVPVTPYFGQYAATQAITANGQAINNGVNGKYPVTCAGAFTGLTLGSAGSFDGQQLVITNAGSGSLTFAASGASKVAAGVAAVIPALGKGYFTWDANSSLWYGP